MISSAAVKSMMTVFAGSDYFRDFWQNRPEVLPGYNYAKTIENK